MKTRICSSWVLGLVLLVLPLAGCLKESSLSPNEAVAAAVEPPPDAPAVEPVEPAADSDMEETLAQADELSLFTAPARKVSAEIQVPANLKPSPATAEMIKLVHAGVEENVMLSFVTNSVGTFNLRAEEIIYLNDIGVPSRVVTAMLQRDHLLQASSANVITSPSETGPSLAAPAEYAEQPFVASEPPPTIFDSAPGYNSDYVPVDTEPSPTDYADYNDALAPYGNWVDVTGVGRCWQPTVVTVDSGWRPYFNCGRWVYTDCGWYWMSDYSWGWAPFHYGRWFQHASLGWCWRPDRVWGPSWVCWRQTGDYCGWAPLPPGARFVAGVGLTFRGHPARHNFSFGLAADHFRFIHTSHFLERDLARQVLPRDQAARIFEHTIASTGIVDHNHRVSNNGIPREHVASAIHRNIIPATLHNVAPSEGVGIRERFERNGRTLAIYRPDLQQRTPSISSTRTAENQLPPNHFSPPPGVQAHNRFANVQPGTSQTGQPATGSSGRADAPIRAGQPLILRGPNNARETAVTTAPNPQNTRRTVPLNSVVIGQNRESHVAAAQPDNRSSWNSRNRAPSYTRDFRSNSSQPVARNYNSRPEIGQSQSPWWAQPQQPRIPDHGQSRQNRELPSRAAGNWNATVEPPRYNSTLSHVPEHTRPAPVETHQSRPVATESRPVHTAPMESHHAPAVPVESHQSHSAPVESYPSPSAPAPSSSSASSSHDSSSHSSSGRSR